MPVSDSFKYFFSFNNLSGVSLGAGGNGIPIINIGTIDVTGYFKYNALSAEQACNIYWNLAGISTGTVKAKVPIVSAENADPPPVSFSNTFGEEISYNGSLFLDNNSSGEGYQPNERMLAFPASNSQEDTENNFATSEPWGWVLRINRRVNSIGSIRAMYANGIFLGYGFGDLARVSAEGKGQDTGNVWQADVKDYRISSWYETDDTDDAVVPTGASGSYDIDYNLVNFGGANFWQRKEEQDWKRDDTEDFIYADYGFTIQASSPSAEMFTYI